MLLCFAPRPLTVQELIEGIAVEVNDCPRLNFKRRLQDSNDIHEICSGFIEISVGAGHTIETSNDGEFTSTVQIAHFSIQEYLQSERIRHQKAAIFSLTSLTAHAEIAQICLVYLLEYGLSKLELEQNVLEEYPLAHFAAMYWYHHFESATNHSSELNGLILRLFQQEESFMTWVKLYDMDLPWVTQLGFSRSLDDVAGPAYYAALLGLDQTLYELINSKKQEHVMKAPFSRTSLPRLFTEIDVQGGSCGNALQAASFEGHETIVQLLLDQGIDVNAQGGVYGNALQAASESGYEKVIQLLLDKGADVNAQSGIYGNALEVASYKGHEKVMQLLLNKIAMLKVGDMAESDS